MQGIAVFSTNTIGLATPSTSTLKPFELGLSCCRTTERLQGQLVNLGRVIEGWDSCYSDSLSNSPYHIDQTLCSKLYQWSLRIQFKCNSQTSLVCSGIQLYALPLLCTSPTSGLRRCRRISLLFLDNSYPGRCNRFSSRWRSGPYIWDISLLGLQQQWIDRPTAETSVIKV